MPLVHTEEWPLETYRCSHCGSLLKGEFIPTNYIGAGGKYPLVSVPLQAVLHLGTCFYLLETRRLENLCVFCPGRHIVKFVGFFLPSLMSYSLLLSLLPDLFFL